jgi:hypothetical protein
MGRADIPWKSNRDSSFPSGRKLYDPATVTLALTDLPSPGCIRQQAGNEPSDNVDRIMPLPPDWIPV